MAPSVAIMAQEHMSEPVSRTYQYRKVMKPMLERKRRARINRCLDELKELMTGALQNNDSENVTKLEKADILELTVRYLHGLKRKDRLYGNGNSPYADRFKAGFKHCAIEVSQFLNKIDQNANAHLMRHLSECIQKVDIVTPPPPVATSHLNRIASPIINESHKIPQFYTKDYPVNMNNNNPNNINNNNNVLKSDTPPINANNNHYLQQQQSNHMLITPERVMYSSRNNNILDSRPVVVINNGNKSPKEEPQSGDVWRPW
ncbi:enhancer of split mgamma protein-like [Culicoides brevitarsis]|uniref:enhancer of split mgamma protein-like n=1 Tax=Culicoides brevitarsis TaxID=469753 RepID=UPI00307B1AEA